MKNDDKKPIEGVANRVSDDADALPIAEENIDHANKPISKGRGLIASLLGGDFSNFTERLMTRSNRKVVEEKARYARSKEELDND